MQLYVIFIIFQRFNPIIKNNKLGKRQRKQLFPLNVQVILFDIAFILFAEIDQSADRHVWV